MRQIMPSPCSSCFTLLPIVNSLLLILSKSSRKKYLRFTPNPQYILEAVKKLVAFIEAPETLGAEREKAISELNLSGTSSTEIEQLAYSHWQEYFAEHMDEILSDRLVIVSHLLEDDVINRCFQDTFQEYQDRKKQLGIDDIRRFWAP